MRAIVSMIMLCLSSVAAENIVITVLYNNVACKENLTTAWGMSCIVTGTEKTILFDTGGDGRILRMNMETLNFRPEDIDIIFLSHIHADHVGGVWSILERNNDVVVYVPRSFPKEFKQNIEAAGARCVSVDTSMTICNNVHSTGELGGIALKEQSLIINTEKGLIVITGCAHPGVVHIVKRASELLKKNVYAVTGGFHLMRYTEKQVEYIIEELKRIGVTEIGPSHCTGGRPIELFREAWGEDFFDFGCGAVYTLEHDE